MSDIEFPVLNVRMVDIDKVIANDYNPNKVAPPEMELLKHSIEEDGYTQPIVTYYDKEKDIYIVVDGFHRYRCAKEYFHLKQIPIVTIDKDLENRMASTIRHNRARGTHQIIDMSHIVITLTQNRLDWKRNIKTFRNGTRWDNKIETNNRFKGFICKSCF